MEFAAATSELIKVFGFGAVFALTVVWLIGRIWEVRTSEAIRAANAHAAETLALKRAAYSDLAKAFRHLMPSDGTNVDPDAFPLAYDRSALFASEEVMLTLGELVELGIKHASNPESVSIPAFEVAVSRCIEAMRKDSGFPNSRHRHRAIWAKSLKPETPVPPRRPHAAV